MKKKELRFIYNSEKQRDREGYGLITALDKHVINDLDISKNTMTETQLAELAENLKVPIDDLFDPHAEKYTDEIKTLSDADKLTMLRADMSLLKTPVIVREDGSAIVLKSPFDLHPIDLEIDGSKDDKF